MPAEQLLSLVQEGLYTILIVSAPVLIIGLVVGVVVSVFQATTQINEQTLTFVPKIVAIFLSLILFGPWMLNRLQEYFTRMFEQINAIIR